MKRLGNVFESICALENITCAHKRASRGKSKYKEVVEFNKDPEKYCASISSMLSLGTFKTSPYKNFSITDRGKVRVISRLPYFPDRVVQWAIMLQIESVFVGHFIFDTYAAIPNKGTHVASNRLSGWLRSDPRNTQYCYKLDVRKFFPSIDHCVLKRLLRKKFKDPDLLKLLDGIVDSTDSGIPIGNYISQYFANYYLSFFDHWVKEVLGIKYYMRYMDDVIMLHEDKAHLHETRKKVEEYLGKELKLDVKGDWQIFKVDARAIDFMGYRHHRKHKTLRRATVCRFKRAMRGIISINDRATAIIASYKGHLQHCCAHNLFKKYIIGAYRE